MPRLCILALTLAFALAPAAASAADDDERAGGRTQRTVTVGFYIYDVREVDMNAQRFVADFYCWVRYHGEESRDLERLEFPNGRIITNDEQERSREAGENYVCWRVSAVFQARFSLRSYPFDAQRLEIMVEHPAYEADQLAYAHDHQSYRRSPALPDRWGIKSGLTIPEFRVLGTELKVMPFNYDTDFGKVEGATIGSTYSRLVLAIRIERIFWPYLYKILIPVIVILGVAYLNFWVPPHELATATVLCMTALLATVVFHTTLSQNLPDTGFLLVPEKLFISALVFVLATLVQSVLTYNLARRGQEIAAYKIDVAARIVFPIVYASGVAFVLLTVLRGER